MKSLLAVLVVMPKEGVALSNDARGHLGPPKFKDARFEHTQANETLDLSTVYR